MKHVKKKMSKESTLSDAIDQINKLQSQVLELQRQLADTTSEARDKKESKLDGFESSHEKDVHAHNTGDFRKSSQHEENNTESNVEETEMLQEEDDDDSSQEDDGDREWNPKDKQEEDEEYEYEEESEDDGTEHEYEEEEEDSESDLQDGNDSENDECYEDKDDESEEDDYQDDEEYEEEEDSESDLQDGSDSENDECYEDEDDESEEDDYQDDEDDDMEDTNSNTDDEEYMEKPKKRQKLAQDDDNKARKKCDVHIQATKILKAVVQEIGGSEPIYQNVSWYISPVEYEVEFYVPSKVGVDGMEKVVICGMMPEGTTKEDACEDVARDALELLQHEHGINVLDYNWIEAAHIRGRCAALVEKFNENKYIYDFICSKSTMVVDGIAFASDIFINKANEEDNAFENIPAQEDIATVLRDCAKELREISQRSREQLDIQDGLTKMLQRMARNQLQRPYVEYNELHFKVGAKKVISGLTVVLEEAASKAGFNMSVVTTEELNGGSYIGRVELQHLASGYKEIFESNVDSNKLEAISTTTKNAIGFLTDKYGLNIVDPSNYASKRLTEIEKAIKKELVHLANGAGAYEDWACQAINDIHILADKYNGSVSQRDAEIKSLLVPICVDLSRHLDPVQKLRKDAKENTEN